MGILDDTLHDADRPLPGRVLQRAVASEPVPEAPVAAPADDGEALTLYRLQKHGAPMAPPAPPAPRAVEAGRSMPGPFHAPVGNFIDATHQFDTSMEGLETGKGQESTQNLDATDRQQPSVSPDLLLRLDYDVATGSSKRSRQTPSPFDDFGNSVQRTDSSDGMRRATGRGAASGDPISEVSPPLLRETTPVTRPRAHDAPMGGPPAEGRALAIPSEGKPKASDADPAMPAALPGRRASTAEASPARQHALAASPGVRAPSPTPVAVGSERPGVPVKLPDEGPRLSIGRIEVTVLSDPQPSPAPARRMPADEAFLSKHYLRRL